MLIDLLSSSNGSTFADTISSFKEPIGYTQRGWIPVFGVFGPPGRADGVDSLLFGFRWTVSEASRATEERLSDRLSARPSAAWPGGRTSRARARETRPPPGHGGALRATRA